MKKKPNVFIETEKCVLKTFFLHSLLNNLKNSKKIMRMNQYLKVLSNFVVSKKVLACNSVMYRPTFAYQ